MVLLLFSVSSTLLLHSGKTDLLRTFKNKFHNNALLYKVYQIAPPGDEQKQDEVRTTTAEMRITRGTDPKGEKEKGSFQSKEQSTDRELTTRRLIQDPVYSRILHFPLQPMDLTISPAEAALHSATITVK